MPFLELLSKIKAWFKKNPWLCYCLHLDSALLKVIVQAAIKHFPACNISVQVKLLLFIFSSGVEWLVKDQEFKLPHL